MTDMNRLAEAIRGVTSSIDRRKLQELGKQFMAKGDFTPQGLQAFASENNLSIEQMQGLVQTVALFKQWEQQAYQQNLGQTPLSSIIGEGGTVNPDITADQAKSFSGVLPLLLRGKEQPKSIEEALVRSLPQGTTPEQLLKYKQGLAKPSEPNAVRPYIGPDGKVTYLPNNLSLIHI